VWLLLVPSGFECYQARGAELREKKNEWRVVSGGAVWAVLTEREGL
jgi:hypothetical protein